LLGATSQPPLARCAGAPLKGEPLQPVKEVSPSYELFGIMGKKRTGGEKNGTVATG